MKFKLVSKELDQKLDDRLKSHEAILFQLREMLKEANKNYNNIWEILNHLMKNAAKK